MTIAAKTLIVPAQLPNAAATQYTSTNVVTIIDKMTLCNTTGGAITVTVYLVESGGTAGASNTVISAQSIAAGTTYTCPEVVGHILSPGAFISAFASAATSVSIRASGRQVS